MQFEPEQEELLARFVDAHHSVPPDRRGGFLAIQTYGQTQTTFVHLYVTTLRFEGSLDDAGVLVDAGLLNLSHTSSGDRRFYVTPDGLQHYAGMRSQVPAAVEDEIARRFLRGPEFRRGHATASGKVEQAVALLWKTDSGPDLTVIGHLCREALRAFTVSLAGQRGVDVSDIQEDRPCDA